MSLYALPISDQPVPPALEAWAATTSSDRLLALAHESAALARRVALRRGLADGIAQYLSTHADSEVRAALVRRADAKITAVLARDAAAEVRAAAASNERCPISMLGVLAKDPSPVVRRAAACHGSLPSELRELLLSDQDSAVRLAVLRREDCTALEMTARIGDPEPAVRAYLAACGVCKHVGGEALSALLNDPEPSVRRAAVEAHEEELAPYLPKLARDGDVEVRRRVAWPRTTRTPAVIEIQAHDHDAEVRRMAALNIFAHPATLSHLARDVSLEVCIGLTNNVLTPPEAMSRLGQRALEGSRNSELVRKVLNHRATPPEVLAALYRRGIEYFNAGSMTEQPNWPASILVEEAMAYAADIVDEELRGTYEAIRQAVVAAAPADAVLKSMLASRIHHLVMFAAASRFTPSEALARFVANHEDALPFIREIASNPATPASVLERLSQEDEAIYHMLQNPELPLPILDKIGERESVHAGSARTLAQARRMRSSS